MNPRSIRSSCAHILALCFFLPALAWSQTVTISPGYTTIGVNDTVQYSATVTGLANTEVTWSVYGAGTISPTGLYTAPSTVPSNGVVITATASDKKTSLSTYVNVANVGPAITAAVPNPGPVGSYTLTLSGSGFKPGMVVRADGINLGVTYISASTIKVAGYQGKAGNVTFMAQNSGTLFGSALVVPFEGGKNSQTISPVSASMNLGGTQQFTSTGATTWKASAGTISSTGLFTAPGTMPSGTSSVTITATGANGSAYASVSLIAAPTQTISPATAIIGLGGTQQFASAGATSWTASAGSVSPSGLYTAPATLPASGNVSITATGPNGAATATVTLLPQPTIQAVGGGSLPLGIFNTTITGTGFTAQSVATLSGKPLSTTYSGGLLKVMGFAGQSGIATLIVNNGPLASPAFPVQVGVQNALVSAAAARRFLEQAAFGPTPADAAHVQQIGMKAWIEEQFSMPQISNYNSITSNQGGLPTHFMTNAVTNPDQLRQRVAFALSQIFVTSINKIIWNQSIISYQNMLLANAFGNYRQIMYDVTLSPAMGEYLDMANNAKANPAMGTLANENYAREIMQLFTMGPNLLNINGTTMNDAHNLPRPAYTQEDIAEFARVYTGWTYAPPAGQPVLWNAYFRTPGTLVSVASKHDAGSKKLLNGYMAPGGVSPLEDLNNALKNIFDHDNVGPFVAKLLIRHLVKSNPSPQYVQDVAEKFNNNGAGVRGDMKAVIMEILLNNEARANDEGGNDQATDGHLQEPALYITGMVRAFAGQMNDQNYWASEMAAEGQDIFSSPSVFNYYSPDYQVPGYNIAGGEFQIYTPNNAIKRANAASTLMFSQYANPVQSYGPGTTVDLTPYVALASTPGILVDAMDLALTHGTMPSAMKSTITAAVSSDASNGAVHQAQTAAYLIVSSNYYNVWH